MFQFLIKILFLKFSIKIKFIKSHVEKMIDVKTCSILKIFFEDVQLFKNKEIFMFSEKRKIKPINKLLQAPLLFHQMNIVTMASSGPHFMLPKAITM